MKQRVRIWRKVVDKKKDEDGEEEKEAFKQINRAN